MDEIPDETGDDPYKRDHASHSDQPDQPERPDDRPGDPGGKDPEDPGQRGMVWQAAPEEAAGLLAGYRSAVRQAEELAVALDTAGLADEVITVTARISVTGKPLVCGVITLTGARRLAEFLAAGGPPPPGLQLNPDRPQWAA